MNSANGILMTHEGVKGVRVEGHKSIHEMVGDWFDCVSRGNLVGYVHDTGLLNGLPINPVATAIFGQIIAGPCVIVRAIDHNDQYDGYDHSLSEADYTYIATVQSAYAMWLESVADKNGV